MLVEPIFFESIFMERVWGGRSFADRYGRDLPPDAVIGESWECVDRSEAQSQVRGGEFDGLSLHELWSKHRARIFGEAYVGHSSERFPILIKLLDAREKLSVQVHPPVEKAAALGGEPKTEMWYFLDCDPGASIYAGLRAGTTRAAFENSLKNEGVEGLIHSIPVSEGRSIFIESGRLHAIGGGNLIVEIQQNSDTTYRVYDWNRMGLDGKPRDLHIAASMESIDFEDFEPELSSPGEMVLADCPFFRVEKCSLREVSSVKLRERFAILASLKSELNVVGQRLAAASFVLLPAGDEEVGVTSPDPDAEFLLITLPTEN
ncbi:MAG: type I phosphomannose isomerase catalytic subunit [Chthoniobacterales bacterium]